jgi:hypothetical protein
MNQIAAALILASAALLLVSSAAAQQVHVANASFTVAVIKANEADKEDIDSDLEDIKDALLGTGYNKHELVSSTPYSCKNGTQINVPLPEGYTCVLWVQATGKAQALQVQVIHKSNKKKPLLTVTVPLKKNKPVLVTGPTLADGSTLVLCFIGR